MATDTDAARDGVLAARAELDEELRRLNASTRSAVDIPAKIRRSPAKAAAIAGGVAFLAVKGPQRVFRAGKRAVRGKDAPLPSKMLPEEIDKALRSLGSDGDKVRGALERDFAAYVALAQMLGAQFEYGTIYDFGTRESHNARCSVVTPSDGDGQPEPGRLFSRDGALQLELEANDTQFSLLVPANFLIDMRDGNGFFN